MRLLQGLLSSSASSIGPSSAHPQRSRGNSIILSLRCWHRPVSPLLWPPSDRCPLRLITWAIIRAPSSRRYSAIRMGPVSLELGKPSRTLRRACAALCMRTLRRLAHDWGMTAVVIFSRLTDEGFRPIGRSPLTEIRTSVGGFTLDDFPDGTYAVEAKLFPLVRSSTASRPYSKRTGGVVEVRRVASKRRFGRMRRPPRPTTAQQL